MPLHNANSLDYLYSLKLPNHLIDWLQGFDENGFWSVEQAKKLPEKSNVIHKGKRQRNNKC